MKFILGKKLHMTQMFALDGTAIPVTVIKAGPCFVTQVKTASADGYGAIQIGYEEIREKLLTKPEKGHLKKIGKNLRTLIEFKNTDDQLKDVAVGTETNVTSFAVGDKIKLTGTSKGRGFQGVVKRHGFHGAPATHGHKDQERMPGSIGATDAQRVFKGRRMGGRMGGDRITVLNLEIVKIDQEKNELSVRGAVPGARGTLVKIIGK